MGNRATISLKNDTQERGIYVHWNGGEGSVRGFIEETKKRLGGKASIGSDEGSIVTFYSTLQGVCREFFGYGGQYKDRSPLSIYHCAHDVKGSTEDNGAYIIEDDFSCERFNHSTFDDKERVDYTHITVFFNEFHHAACAVFDDEMPRFSNSETVQGLKADMAAAEVTVKKAQSRIDRLKARIEQLENSQAAAELEAR